MIMTSKEKIKNSIRAYIMGDALGVPFEFKMKGTFKCQDFIGFGTYQKPAGTWSDDTTFMLCLMDAFCRRKEGKLVRQVFMENLVQWYYTGTFTVDGLFDIGSQTANAILRAFPQERTHFMGNGAMFYSLPLACVFLTKDFKKEDFEAYCKVTHFNENCFDYGYNFVTILRQLLLQGNCQQIEIPQYRNCGDIINTFNLVLDNFFAKKDRKSTLIEDLYDIINLGQDTDTNAAFLGALLGTIKPVEEKDWQKVREYKYLDRKIDNFVERCIERW